MDLQNLPTNFLNRLNLHCFGTNLRNHNLPSLWCICSKNFSPQLLQITDQFVSFKVDYDSAIVFLTVVYASTNATNRKKLWYDLSGLLKNFKVPWCFVGDFNAIFGSHENRGRASPFRSSIVYFCYWIYHHCLANFPTSGLFVTWSNGRFGS